MKEGTVVFATITNVCTVHAFDKVIKPALIINVAAGYSLAFRLLQSKSEMNLSHQN